MSALVKKLVLAASILALIWQTNAGAQVLPSAVSLGLNPKFPGPNEMIAVKATTLTTPANSTFRWFLNGALRTADSGVGRDQFSFITGGLGTGYQIEVVVTSAANPPAQATVNFKISDLSLVWSSNSQVPVWYRGKALAIPESRIRTVALPIFIKNGVQENPDTINFTWFLDDELMNDFSGLGKQSFEFLAADSPRAIHNIRVVTENRDQTNKNEKTIFIKTVLPEVVIYPSRPLEGIQISSAVKETFTGSLGSVFDFVAETFFTSPESKKIFRWQVGEETVVGEPASPNTLTLTTGQQAPNQTPIGLSIENPKKPIQNIFTQFTLELK